MHLVEAVSRERGILEVQIERIRQAMRILEIGCSIRIG